MWNVGACFTCVKCLLRSVWRKCPRCGGETVDLRSESLEVKWSAWRGFAEGWSLVSFRGVRAMKVIRRFAALITVGAVLSPVVGPLLRGGHTPELLELVIGFFVGLLFAWPIFEFMSLYLLFFAHVLRGLSWLTSLGAEISPVGTLKLSVIAKLTRWLSRALIPQIEVMSSSLDGVSLRGVLAVPTTFHFVRDGWGFLERFDVHVPEPLKVTLDGREESLTLSHGAVILDGGVRSEGSTLPQWLEVPKRAGVRFRREVPAGAQFVLTRSREGLDDARVMLRFV